MNLCKYKNALGELNKGIHSYRLFGVSMADVIMTFIGAFIISYFSKISFIKTLLILFLLGIVLIVLSVTSKSDSEKCSDKLKKNNLYVLIIGIAICLLCVIFFILKSRVLNTTTKFSF